MSYKAYYTYSNILKNVRKRKSLNFFFFFSTVIVSFKKSTHFNPKEPRALSRFFGPPLKPKNGSCITPISSDCFIRSITQMFKCSIYLTFTVAIVTENGRRNRLKIGRSSFWTKFQSFDRQIYIEHKQIPKTYFNS